MKFYFISEKKSTPWGFCWKYSFGKKVGVQLYLGRFYLSICKS